MSKNFSRSSWQKVAPWYNRITEGGQGHYYHLHVVIPGVIKLLDLKSDSKLLDIACGNGVLAKSIPKNIEYTGIDIAPSLISEAKRTDRNPKHKYLTADATREFQIPNGFTHAAVILALQNIQNPIKVLQNISQHIIINGVLVVVLNHPAFRIPRQTAWGIDEGRKIQYRRVDKYMSPMTIPINMNPSDRNSQITMSYHFPVSAYSKMLKDTGFVIEEIEEWTSDKESVGRAGKMENRSRAEIPLFMTIKAVKK
ncbi:MAG: methyltransferase [Candidatus Microgenomates bacterium]|jgi:ubiquinone/menaquinone biosynthesis C-methylase UbiE